MDSDFEEDLNAGMPGRLRVLLNGIGDTHGRTVAASFLNHSTGISPVPASGLNATAHIGVLASAAASSGNTSVAVYAMGTGGNNSGDDYSFYGFGQLHNVGNITTTGTVDGRDVAADGTKLDGIETGADVTDATNVQNAGAYGS